MTAEVASADETTLSIQALKMTTGPTGGREISGQLYAVVPANTTGTEVFTRSNLGWFSDGTIPVAYSDGTIALGAYSTVAAGFQSAEQTVRIDFTATLRDQAFEEYDSFGGTRNKRDEPQRF